MDDVRTGRVTDTLLTLVTASLVVLGVASTQGGSVVQADAFSAPVRAAAPVAPAAPAVAAAVVPAPVAAAVVPAPVVPAPDVPAPVGSPPAAAVAAPAPSAPVASAPETPSSCSGEGWQQRRGEAAMASLRPGSAPGYPVTFKPAKKGFYGLTKPREQTIDIYVRDCTTESDALLRHVVAHEIGHALDKTVLTDGQRSAWLATRGIAVRTTWYGCNRCTDFGTPAGDFAEVYAQWRRGATDNRSTLAGAPGPAALDALAREFFGA